jgi:UDP-N-acetylmuramate--alanine ligase
MIVPVPEVIPPARDLGRVHFVGLGGYGLSGIARLMIGEGVTVSGSDKQDSKYLHALSDLGAATYVGHDAAHLGDADTLVVSTAIREDNPEVVAARERGLLILPRSAALRSVMLGRRVLAVTGTHGKTTATSMLTVMLQHVGADPSYAIGGSLLSTGVNAGLGSGPDFVAEADESDGSFLVYRAFGAIVTNIDSDHLDYWGTEAAYRAAYVDFLDTFEPGGFLVVGTDDPGAAHLGDIAEGKAIRTIRVGFDERAELRAVDAVYEGMTSSFDVMRLGERLGRVTLRIPGHHYVVDALCALACALELGHQFDALVDGLEGYTGTARRLEFKGEEAGVRVFDTYAHHHLEISGDLEAARVVAGAGRLIACYQPNPLNRLRYFYAEMGQSLSPAEVVVVLDVDPGRDDPDPAVTGQLVVDHVGPGPELVVYEPQRDRAAEVLADLVRPGDLVLTLGSGNVTTLGPELLALLRQRGRQASAAGEEER